MSDSTASQPGVVITGASTGIGEACALELDRRGFRVFAGVRSQEAADRLRAKSSAQLTPVLIDVTAAASIAAAAKNVSDVLGESGLAGLVNNAGIVVPGPLEAVPIDALRRQLEVNVIGQAAVTQALLPMLRKACGRIVNMSSISGGISVPCLGPYCMSKWALEAFNDTLRQELRRTGIHVASIAPGAINTPIWEKSMASGDDLSKAASPEILARYEPELAAARNMASKSVASAAPVERVVGAVVHALTAWRPKTHYYLGWDVRVCYKGMKMLPDRARDWIVRNLLGL